MTGNEAFEEILEDKDLSYMLDYNKGYSYFEIYVVEIHDPLNIGIPKNDNDQKFVYRPFTLGENKPEPVHFEQTNLFNQSEEIKVEEKATVQEDKPEIIPIQAKPQEKETPKPAYEAPKVVEEQIAVSYVPPVLDEKQASRLEQHLLELDPSLRKHEAKFYARHCTLGKKYTISQYKKAIGCVYETARTSMDHLVELGYYRKEAVKNKNVYTPIPRKD